MSVPLRKFSYFILLIPCTLYIFRCLGTSSFFFDSAMYIYLYKKHIFVSITRNILPRSLTTRSKWTVESAEQCIKSIQIKVNKKSPKSHWHHYSVFIINFEHILRRALLFLLLYWTGKYRMIWLESKTCPH